MEKVWEEEEVETKARTEAQRRQKVEARADPFEIHSWGTKFKIHAYSDRSWYVPYLDSAK